MKRQKGICNNKQNLMEKYEKQANQKITCFLSYLLSIGSKLHCKKKRRIINGDLKYRFTNVSRVYYNVINPYWGLCSQGYMETEKVFESYTGFFLELCDLKMFLIRRITVD